MHAEIWVTCLAKLEVRASYHRWNYVEEGVIRAPLRQPGIIGDNHAFWIEEGYVLRCGRKFHENREIGWSMQSMVNHEHPKNTERLSELPIIYEYAKTLQEDLETWFPDRRFIVGIEPGCSVSFYEPEEDAPTESETEWNGHIGAWAGDNKAVADAVIDSLQLDERKITIIDETLPTCNECGGTKVVQPYESIKFPGVIEAYCDRCGAGFIAASRYMRFKVGSWPSPDRV